MSCDRRLETRPRLGARGGGAVTTKSSSRPAAAALLTSDRGQRAQYQNAPALAELHESEPACGQLGAQCNINKAAATVPERRSTVLRGLPVRFSVCRLLSVPIAIAAQLFCVPRADLSLY